jgi:hypothetical protein
MYVLAASITYCISDHLVVLQEPSVAAAPLDKRIAFLQSKNLTQEEVDIALARAGETSNSPPPQAPSSSNYAYRQPPPPPPGYPPYPGYWQPPPPEVPRRDWRDWFIMATVMGGVGYGLYFTAKVINRILGLFKSLTMKIEIHNAAHRASYPSSTRARQSICR